MFVYFLLSRISMSLDIFHWPSGQEPGRGKWPGHADHWPLTSVPASWLVRTPPLTSVLASYWSAADWPARAALPLAGGVSNGQCGHRTQDTHSAAARGGTLLSYVSIYPLRVGGLMVNVLQFLHTFNQVYGIAIVYCLIERSPDSLTRPGAWNKRA